MQMSTSSDDESGFIRTTIGARHCVTLLARRGQSRTSVAGGAGLGPEQPGDPLASKRERRGSAP